ncbi:MAG: hypothetical protein ABIO49_04985 [Dokdonella sp.]
MKMLRETGWAIATALLATMVAWHAFGFSFIRMNVPIVYSGDAIQYAYVYQANREDGWNEPISRAGAPFGTSNYDFPNADGLNLLLTRVLGFIADDPFTIFNLYILSTFLLCGLISYAVFRRLGLNGPWAAVASLVFNLLPFHFQRLAHLFYLMYASAALAGWLALDVVYEGTGTSRTKRWLAVCAALVCGATGIYYAFFSCIVVLVAMLCAAAASATLRPLFRGGVLVALIVAATTVNVAPTWWYTHQHGHNPEVATREPRESEIYGLKLTQLMLPRSGYRIPYVANARAAYERSAPLSNENQTASLGIIGAFGFFLLLVVPFLGRSGAQLPRVLHRAAAPTYAAFLYATIGGFGALFALLVTPQLRALNRISPVIAFFATLASIVAVSSVSSRWRRGWITALIAGGVIGLCLFDQVAAGGRRWEQYYVELTKKFDRDHVFFHQLEEKLPAGAMVMQLPLMSYPEAPQANLGSYDLSTAYLHTKKLRWTFGAMRGRPEELWQRLFLAFGLSKQITAMKALGFVGIVVDRRGYADRASALDDSLSKNGLMRSLASEVGDREFYPLADIETAEHRAFAVAPSKGWFDIKARAEGAVASSGGDASILIGNIAGTKHGCHLEFDLETVGVARNISVWDGSRNISTESLTPGTSMRFSMEISMAEGSREISLHAEPPAMPTGASGEKSSIAFNWLANEVPLCR